MMEMTKERLKGSNSAAPLPLGVKPAEAARLIGESRNTVYRLLAAGKLRAVKRGTSTLVVTDSIREHFASLPAAIFLPRN